VNVFFEKIKEKQMFLDEKGFCREGFVLKIVSNRRDTIKGFSMLYKGLSKF
jgi:hypothetical protein